MTREDFYKRVYAKLESVIANQELDAWFFNDYDEDMLRSLVNDEINKTLNKLIPGHWVMVALSGNFTNVGLGIFYEKDYDLWLDLACYDEENEEYIDTFNLYDKCPFKFDDETLARISHI